VPDEEQLLRSLAVSYIQGIRSTVEPTRGRNRKDQMFIKIKRAAQADERAEVEQRMICFGVLVDHYRPEVLKPTQGLFNGPG